MANEVKVIETTGIQEEKNDTGLYRVISINVENKKYDFYNNLLALG